MVTCVILLFELRKKKPYFCPQESRGKLDYNRKDKFLNCRNPDYITLCTQLHQIIPQATKIAIQFSPQLQQMGFKSPSVDKRNAACRGRSQAMSV